MDPITISAGIQAVGGLFKGLMGFLGGNSQAKAMEAAARQAGAEAGVQSQEAVMQGNAAAAQGAVQAAANGGGFVGSALSQIQNLSNQAMFNARAAAYRGATEVQRDLYQAKVAKAQGFNSLMGGAFGAVGSLAAGGAQKQLLDRYDAAAQTLRGETGYGADASGDDLSGLH